MSSNILSSASNASSVMSPSNFWEEINDSPSMRLWLLKTREGNEIPPNINTTATNHWPKMAAGNFLR